MLCCFSKNLIKVENITQVTFSNMCLTFNMHYAHNFLLHYDNSGCGVFKRGIQNKKDVWLKINFGQMKLLNWSSGELSKIGHHFRK